MLLAQRLLFLMLAGLSLLVALFGLFQLLVEVGQSPTRYVVQDAAVFAAGVLGMALCWRQGRKVIAKQEGARDESRRFTGRVLEASAQPWKQALGLALFGLMAVFTLWVFVEDGDWRAGAAGALSAALFLVMIPMVASHYRNGRPTLRLDARGLEHAWLGDVPWTAVHGLHLKSQTFRQVTVHSLVLGVARPGDYVARMPWAVRLMSGKWETPRGRYGCLEIPLKPLDKDPLLVMNAALALRDRVSPPRLRYWQPSLDHESIAIGLESDYLGENPDRLPEDELLARRQALQPRIQAMADRLLQRR